MKRKKIISVLIIIMLCSNVVLCYAKSENRIRKGNIQYIKILNKNSVKLGWKKLKNIKKYQVQYSKKKNMKNAITKIVRKQKSCKIKHLKNGGKYYFRVRGIKGKMRGAWSKRKKITIDADSIDAIRQINSKYNLKLPLNAEVMNYRSYKENYYFDGKKYKGCKIFAKIHLNNSDFKTLDKIIQKSKQVSYSIYDTDAKELEWWNLKKKNILRGQDFFNTIRVFENKQDNQGIVIRGHMEVYVTKGIKKGYKMVYICYEGG